MKMLEHWLPDEAGDPVACLATSFTFDADFFFEDCLARFLSLSGRDLDSTEKDLAGMIEEEERLADARVCVLVDQSCQPTPRNLRWDLLPIRVPGGLLHAKVAVLMWESATRVIIGSANLTTAGYRSQVEICAALELGDSSKVPRHVFEQLNSELRSILALAPGVPETPGPVQRATEILDEFSDRIEAARLPSTAGGSVRIALAPGRRGVSPLDRLGDVWSGSKPQDVTALSPFWDDTEAMPGARSVLSQLAERAPAGGRTCATFVVAVDPSAGVVRAPATLMSVADTRIDARVVAFDHGDEIRRLHAKCVQYRSTTWSATMFGSSNLTAKGLGLDAATHREINIWIGCRAGTAEHTALDDLVRCGPEVDLTMAWEPEADDEDETVLDPLPTGFGGALIVARDTLQLTFTHGSLPAEWQVEFEAVGRPTVRMLDSEDHRAAGRPTVHNVTVEGDMLPSSLTVTWTSGGQPRQAAWFVNVGDQSLLPAPADLRALSADVLLTVLASTRPLRAAIEAAIRGGSDGEEPDELDPLKRFDSSRLLLQRARRSSAALWGIDRRLNRPIPNLDALEWRLAGTLGPEHLATKLAEDAKDDQFVPGEAQFLLAELALTVSRVPWTGIARDIDAVSVRSRVGESISRIQTVAVQLGATTVDPSISAYVTAALAEAAR